MGRRLDQVLEGGKEKENKRLMSSDFHHRKAPKGARRASSVWPLHKRRLGKGTRLTDDWRKSAV